VQAVLGRRDDASLAVSVEGDGIVGRNQWSGRCRDGVVAEETCGQACDGTASAGQGQETAAGQGASPGAGA
jgi:hypothetical protein